MDAVPVRAASIRFMGVRPDLPELQPTVSLSVLKRSVKLAFTYTSAWVSGPVIVP